LLVTTSEYIDSSRQLRAEYIRRSLASSAGIPTEQTRVIININCVDSATYRWFSDQFRDIPLDVEVRRAVKNYSDNYLLCWEHKDHMLDFLQSDFDHFVYYENDLDLQSSHINYWLETTELFARNNLPFIPGFHRIEQAPDGRMVSLDIINPQVGQPRIIVEGQEFIAMDVPYQAMLIMNRAQVEEHAACDLFRYEPVAQRYAVSERANIGNLYHNVPNGFAHRALVPVNDFSKCWIHHMPNKFVNMLWDPFGKLPIEQVIPAK
jgi:hypothetical protein